MFSAVSLVLFLIIPAFSTGEFAYCDSVPGLQLRLVATEYGLEGYLLNGEGVEFQPAPFCDMNSKITTIQDADTAIYHDPDLNTDLYIIDVDKDFTNEPCVNRPDPGDEITLKGSGFTSNRASGLEYIDTSNGRCSDPPYVGTYLMGRESGYQINVKYVRQNIIHAVNKVFVVVKSRGLIGPQASAAITSVGIDDQRGPPRTPLT